MSNRRLRSLSCAVAVVLFAFLAGCVNMEFAPQDPYPYWYYPKELPEAGRAVEAARLEGKDKKCPSEFKAAEDLKNKAYEVYVSCRTQEAIAMADEATAKAQALCPKEHVVDKLTLRVHFAFDKALIRKSDEKELNKAITFIKNYPGYKVKLEGHTDGIGTEKYNQRLSERRANAVKNYLVSHGAANKDKISTVGYGKTKPLASNDTKKGRAENRRTEILILSD